MQLLGIDTGGTFTDFVYFDGDTIRTHKVLSTPGAPDRAIMQGIEELGIELAADLHVIHGSTVATNAVLEGKGANTVYITNRGFEDVLTIGRQARKELYNLTPIPESPPVPASHCLGTGGRLSSNAEVLEPLSSKDLTELREQLERLKPEAVAINLLFSYLDGRFEDEIADIIPEEIFISCSSRVLPVYREYERGITSWLNAYVGPLMQRYLSRLQIRFESSRLSIMRSSGDTCNAEQAGNEAVHLLLSGPAGGLTAAQYLTQGTDDEKLLTFDMGGTSTDVALIEGQLELTGDGYIAGYPVGVPMVNIHTIGAGGGSIAYVDDGGLLQVGPESAGAKPGPACYGQGGKNATVTDANLILGRIPASIKFGDSITIDLKQAEQAISRLTEQLGLESNEETALGIIRIANEHMAQALRVISVERGIDPRKFSLMAFGGAGGLHACELAEHLGLSRAIVPAQAGVLSALGMLVAEPGRQLTKTLDCLLSDIDDAEIESSIHLLVQQACEALEQEGRAMDRVLTDAYLDLCYQGQASTLSIAWKDRLSCEKAFHVQHQQRYGHRLDTDVALLNVRVGVNLKGNELVNSIAKSMKINTVINESNPSTPAIIGETSLCEAGATIWVAPGWIANKNNNGHIVLTNNNNEDK